MDAPRIICAQRCFLGRRGRRNGRGKRGGAMIVKLKSAYLPYDSKDGARYLVETLWPEGVETYSLSPYLWAHDLAPSYDMKETALWKQWSPEKFREEYRKELETPHRSAWFTLLLSEARE